MDDSEERMYLRRLINHVGAARHEIQIADALVEILKTGQVGWLSNFVNAKYAIKEALDAILEAEEKLNDIMK